MKTGRHRESGTTQQGKLKTEARLGIEVDAQALAVDLEIRIDDTDPGFDIRRPVLQSIVVEIVQRHHVHSDQTPVSAIQGEPDIRFKLETEAIGRGMPENLIVIEQHLPLQERQPDMLWIVTRAEECAETVSRWDSLGRPGVIRPGTCRKREQKQGQQYDENDSLNPHILTMKVRPVRNRRRDQT